MSENDDHREKNILLAKNLNAVKMDLRLRTKDLANLHTELRNEKTRNYRLESEQVTILNCIDSIKKQLDETFLKHTVGYIHLSRQIDQMHQKSIESSMLDVSSKHANSIVKAGHSVFLDEIKKLGQSMVSNNSIGGSLLLNDSNANFEVSGSSMGESYTMQKQSSLSFNSFEMGLNSTFVREEDEDSELNRTFLTESDGNRSREKKPALQELHSNITVRKRNIRRKSSTSFFKKAIKTYSRLKKENQTPITAGDSVNRTSTSMVLRRSTRKINYKEL